MGSTENFFLGGYMLFKLAIVLTLLAFIFVGLRIWIRQRFRRDGNGKELGWDDACICASMILAIVMASMTMVSIYFGFGNPSRTLATHDVHKALQMFWVTQSIYKAIMMFTKLSMLCLYARVFAQRPWFLQCCYFVGGFIVLYAASTILATILQCWPIMLAWDKSIKGHCINLGAFWYSNAVVSISTDLAIIVLPMYPVYHLHAPRRTKFLLCGVFAVGGIVTLASILRMTTLKMGAQNPDQMTGTLASTTWTIVEVNVGIIGACLPLLRNAIVRFLPRLMGISSRHRSSSSDAKRSNTPKRSSFNMRSALNPHGEYYTHFEGRRLSGRHSTAAGSGDAILHDELEEIPMGAIQKTTDLEIVVSDREDTDNNSSLKSTEKDVTFVI